MSKNIEINVNTGSTYEVLYPKTLIGNVTDGASQSYVQQQDNGVKEAVKVKMESGSYRGTGTFVEPSSSAIIRSISISFCPDFFVLKSGGSLESSSNVAMSPYNLGLGSTYDSSLPPIVFAGESIIIGFMGLQTIDTIIYKGQKVNNSVGGAALSIKYTTDKKLTIGYGLSFWYGSPTDAVKAYLNFNGSYITYYWKAYKFFWN